MAPKVRTISRQVEEYTRDRPRDVVKVFRNPDPALHPFERAREYTRALNAVKLDSVFAKPFVAALDGHRDGVYAMTKISHSLSHVLSGSADGVMMCWDMRLLKKVWEVQAHDSYVNGIACDRFGKFAYTCSNDQSAKLWKIPNDDMSSDSEDEYDDAADEDEEKEKEIFMPGVTQYKISKTPLVTMMSGVALEAIDTHKSLPGVFGTAGGHGMVEIWNTSRTKPIHSFQWGMETIYTLRFSPSEKDLLATSASDRGLVLYDLRSKTPLHKAVQRMRANQIAWNPQEPFMFSTANEDGNAYTFDMRKLVKPRTIHKDHLNAVMSLDYSPTGREFVTGGYDRTVRIFSVDAGHSREVYHTKRMQRVFSVCFTADSKYVLSGSDDTNIRVWKAQRSRQRKILLPRERDAQNYNDKLKQRFAHAPEIRRIARHRHLPKVLKKAAELEHVIKSSRRRKLENRRLHSKPGAIPYVDEKRTRVPRTEQ